MKTRFTIRLLLCAALALLVFFQSCTPESDPIIPQGADGFFVVNEGGFGDNNASLSFFDRKTGNMTNDVFFIKNGLHLGDQAQSMTVFEGKGYIVVQNSGKVEVIDASDFSSIQTITEDIESPRYFIGVTSTKGYVSDWGDGFEGSVKVIDLTTFEVVKTIPTGSGANRFLKKGSELYVANAGGYGKDNTVKVIDINTDEIIHKITVGDNPTSLQLDKDGNVWVASSGATAYNDDYSVNEEASTKGSISKIGADYTEVLRLEVNTLTYPPLSQFEINAARDKLYYLFVGGIYEMSTTATALPSTPIIAKDYYGMAVDPFNGDIIGCVGIFSSNSKIDVYNSGGTFQKSLDVGIGPNGCAFK